MSVAGRRAAPGRVFALLLLALGASGLADGIGGRDAVELVVDADRPVGRLRPIWDELNLWKLMGRFGVQASDPAGSWGAGWLRARVPWATYGRVLAALGGNYAPELARWCDHGAASAEHPYERRWECGRDGVPGPAAANELVREVEGRWTVDYAPFRTALARLVASGLRPHLNLSAVPVAFTGAADFTHYHWNAAPARDLDAWRTFVAGAFAAVRDLGPAGWRVSIVNEPNCLTLVGWQQEVRHVGFTGTPDEYARMFAAAAAATRANAPGARIHAGNYVTSDTFAGENNLADYLAALRDRLAEGDFRWTDLAAVSLSLYETDDTTVYDFVPVRIARLETAERAAGLPLLPVKVDELDIHPAVAAAFDARHHQRLDTTLFAASWHAEAVRLLLDAGTVTSLAPWLDRMLDLKDWTPYPKARAYVLYGLLAGQLRPASRAVASSATVPFERTGRSAGLRRLAVRMERCGGAPCPDAANGSGLPAALATRAPGGVRVLVVHHQGIPVEDVAPLRRALARDVRVQVRGLRPGAYAVRHLALGGPAATRWDGTRAAAAAWREDGCRAAPGGTLELVPPTPMDANTLWYYEASRRPQCARAPDGR